HVPNAFPSQLKLINFVVRSSIVRQRVTGPPILFAAFLVTLGGLHARATGQANPGSKSGGTNNDEVAPLQCRNHSGAHSGDRHGPVEPLRSRSSKTGLSSF